MAPSESCLSDFDLLRHFAKPIWSRSYSPYLRFASTTCTPVAVVVLVVLAVLSFGSFCCTCSRHRLPHPWPWSLQQQVSCEACSYALDVIEHAHPPAMDELEKLRWSTRDSGEPCGVPESLVSRITLGSKALQNSTKAGPCGSEQEEGRATDYLEGQGTYAILTTYASKPNLDLSEIELA